MAPARAARPRGVLEPRLNVPLARDARSRVVYRMRTCRPRPSCACPRSRARRLSRRPCTARSPPHRDAGAGTLSDCAICPSAGRPCGPCDGTGRGWEAGERGVLDVVSRCARSSASRRAPRRARAPPRARIRLAKNVSPRKTPPARRSSRATDSRISSYPRSRAFLARRRRERTEGNARRSSAPSRAVPRARSRGHALEHFEVHVVSHLLPGADAVLLHGVAQRLLLRGVPVPSEGHLRRLAPRLGLRLGFHRADRAADRRVPWVRARSATPLVSERTRPNQPVAAARALATCRARGIERAAPRRCSNASRAKTTGKNFAVVNKQTNTASTRSLVSRVTDRAERSTPTVFRAPVY